MRRDHSSPETCLNARENPERKAYPSDPDDLQWRRLRSLLPQPPEGLGRPRETDLRDVVAAINYRWSTGCSWRMLPHDFPPWATVYAYFRRWERAGILTELREILLRPFSVRRSTTHDRTVSDQLQENSGQLE